MIDSESLNDSVKSYITNSSQNLQNAILNNFEIFGYKYTVINSSNEGKYSIYNLDYKYNFDKGNVIFQTTVKNKEGKYSIIGFNGQVIKIPIEEMNQFSFSGKTFKYFFFLTLCILIPLFILITFIIMLKTRISTKKKVIWGLIILIISLPRFVINWSTGETDFNFIYLSFLGYGISRENIYAAWILSFNLPIGALIFWFKRGDLIYAYEIENEDSLIEENKTADNSTLLQAGFSNKVK
jgi:hypothetical protein